MQDDLNEYKENISNQEINELEIIEFQGDIHIIDSLEAQKEATDHLLTQPVLGFDTEAKPSFKKGVIHPVSLLQLATTQEVFLFRLKSTGISDRLKEVLESTYTKKIGVAIRDDINDLKKLRKFSDQGFLSLEKEVKKVGIESNGLRKLAAIVLEGRISKSAQVSNWEAEELTSKQLTYAATDAWVSLAILQNLQNTHPELFRY